MDKLEMAEVVKTRLIHARACVCGFINEVTGQVEVNWFGPQIEMVFINHIAERMVNDQFPLKKSTLLEAVPPLPPTPIR